MDVEAPLTVPPADHRADCPSMISRAFGLAGFFCSHAVRLARGRLGPALVLLPLAVAAAGSAGCGSSDENGSNPLLPDAGDGALPDGQTPLDRVCSVDGWCWDVPFPQGCDLAAVWAFSATEAWFVGTKGTILHLSDGHWQAAVSPTTRDLKAIWASGPADIWAVGTQANLLHYDGHAWTLEHGTPVDPEPVDGGFDAAADASDAGDAGPPGLPDGRDYLGIFGVSNDDIWLVGTKGTIAHYDGDTWIATQGVTTGTVRTGWASASDNVYIAGDSLVFRYDGEVWAKVDPGITRSWYDIDGTSEEDVWLVGSGNYYAHFNGSKWANDRFPGGTAYTVVADTAESAWGFGDHGLAWHWDGESWTSVSTGTRQTIWGSSRYSAGKFLVAGSSGAIVQWDNDARAVLTQSFDTNFLGIAGTASDDIWVVGDSVLHGNTEVWGLEAPPVNRSLFAVWAGAQDNVWAVGTGGTILGRSLIGWVVTSSPTEEWLRGVWGAGSGAGWVVGDKGTILGLINGASWSAVPSGTTADLYGVWGPSSAEAWAVGDKGTILHFTAGQWKPAAVEIGDAGAPFRGTLHAVWGSAASDVWAVGSQGAKLHYNGSVWRVVDAGAEDTLNAVWGRSATDIWAVGTSGTILHYNGSSWEPSASGATADLRAVWGTDDFTWAVGDRGTILRRSVH